MPRRPMNGVRKHVVLTQRQYAELVRIANDSGLPMTEVVRRAIDDYLENYSEVRSRRP